MNRQENIKRIYEQAKFDTQVEKDKAILKKMKEIYLQESKAEPKSSELSIWRIIMKSKISKLAAAAVIIIAATLLLQNGSFRITTPTFGLEDVYNAIDNMEWVHFKLTIVQMSGDTETEKKTVGDGWESWSSEKNNVSAEKHTDGKIFFTEKTERGIRKSIYTPESNSITIKYEPFDSSESYGNYKNKFKASLLDLENKGAKIKYNKGVFEGQPVINIIVDYMPQNGEGYHSIITCIVDPVTYLLKKMEWQQTALKKNLTAKSIGIVDYPKTGPKDIYEAGASQDAKVIEEIQDEK